MAMTTADILAELERGAAAGDPGVNLDACNEPDWLDLFWRCTHLDPVHVAGLLFPSKLARGLVTDEMIQATETLGHYANAKSMAVRARLAGDVVRAQRAEELCDMYYSNLPDWARTW